MKEIPFEERIKGYTRAELDDILCHIDKEKWPDRAELVREELASCAPEEKESRKVPTGMLTSREITSIAAKVIAAYLIFSVILSIPIWVAFAYRQIDNLPVVLALAAIGVILGLLAIRAVREFANRLLRVEGERLDFHVNAFRLEQVLLRCLGLYFAVGTVRDIVRDAITIGHWQYRWSDLTLAYVNLFTGIAVFLIALSLIAKPAKWMSAMRKLRRL